MAIIIADRWLCLYKVGHVIEVKDTFIGTK